MRRALLLGFALATMSGCASGAAPRMAAGRPPPTPPPASIAATPPEPEPERAEPEPERAEPEPERVCSWLTLPLLILFGCHSTDIDRYINRGDPLGWFVEWVRTTPGIVERIRLLGYQSVLGPESEVPTTLSQRRAEAVAEALAGRGIAPERIEAIGEGHWIHTAPHYDDCRVIDRQRQVAFHVLLCATAEEAEAARRLH